MADYNALTSLQIYTKLKQSVSLFREVLSLHLPKSVKISVFPRGVTPGAEGMHPFFRKSFRSLTLTRPLPSEGLSKAQCILQNCWGANEFQVLVPKVQKYIQIYTNKKITFFLLPGDTTTAEYYNQNNDQNQKQWQGHCKQSYGPGRQGGTCFINAACKVERRENNCI